VTWTVAQDENRDSVYRESWDVLLGRRTRETFLTLAQNRLEGRTIEGESPVDMARGKTKGATVEGEESRSLGVEREKRGRFLGKLNKAGRLIGNK
jgi:hypothetical protein